MLRDSQLLDTLRLASARPVLRFFRWWEPTVSYGRLQSEEAARSYAVSQGVRSVVRRPTGGGMVLHRDDLSWSFLWRKGDPQFPCCLKDIYRAMHQAAALAFTKAGHPATFAPPASGQGRPGLCFQEPVENDLLFGGKKVCGGAIQVTAWGRLYQGNIQGLPVSEEDLLRALLVTLWGDETAHQLMQTAERVNARRGLPLSVQEQGA